MNTTTKTLVFWLALLVTATLLYEIVQHRPLQAVTPNRVAVTTKVEYSLVPVGPSWDALRAVLESKGTEGWELAAPVVNNGTTTAFIFRRERK